MQRWTDNAHAVAAENRDIARDAKRFSWWAHANDDQLSALDLIDERAKNPGSFAIEIELPHSPTNAQGLVCTNAGRIGIAWGADASWGDVASVEGLVAEGEIESAINDWLNDPDAWEGRQ